VQRIRDKPKSLVIDIVFLFLTGVGRISDSKIKKSTKRYTPKIGFLGLIFFFLFSTPNPTDNSFRDF
jgi:hypothetical protein